MSFAKRGMLMGKVVQRKNGANPGLLGPTVPLELLFRSRVTQILWALRGSQHGVSLTDLCAQGPRTETQARAQIAAAQSYLRRVGSCWEILSEERETEEGARETYYFLVAPHCPRPARREIPELTEPEFISFDEIETEFPVLPRWE